MTLDAGRAVNMPNLLSLLRVPLAAAFLLVPGTLERAIIIVAAGVSDYADGWWARTRGPATKLGALLDPITDKIFVVVALLAFLLDGTLSLAGLLLLLARDIFVTAGSLLVVLAGMPLRMRARFPGKVVTTLQIVAVLALTVLPGAATPLIVLTALAGVWAILDYAVAAVRALRAQAQRR